MVEHRSINTSHDRGERFLSGDAHKRSPLTGNMQVPVERLLSRYISFSEIGRWHLKNLSAADGDCIGMEWRSHICILAVVAVLRRWLTSAKFKIKPSNHHKLLSAL